MGRKLFHIDLLLANLLPAYNNFGGYNQTYNDYGGENNYTTTSYGAQGGADGGGFMPGSQGGTQKEQKVI